MPADAEAAHATAPRRARRALRVAGVAAGVLLLLVTTLLYFAPRWYLHRYGRIGFDSVLQAIVFHAQAAEEGQIRSFLVVTNDSRTPEKNYDLSLIFDFDSVEDLNIYRDSEPHLAFRQFITPLRELRACIDYEF